MYRWGFRALSFPCYRLSQHYLAALQADPHGGNRHPQNLGNPAVIHILEIIEDERLAIFWIQGFDAVIIKIVPVTALPFLSELQHALQNSAV